MPLWRRTVLRVVGSLATLFAVSVAFFALIEVAPGDYAAAISGPQTSDADRNAIRVTLGLDQPLIGRYLSWCRNALQGDLGVSWWTGEPIADFIWEPVWQTLWLALLAGLVAVPLGLLLGVTALAWRRTPLDPALGSLTLAAASMPDFLIAYGLMALLGVHFQWFPVHTFYLDEMSLAARLEASALPVAALTAMVLTPVYRATRAALANELGSEYVEMARLKGLGEFRILVVHMLPNALAPVANTLVQVAGQLLLGLVVIETVFSFPGFGSLLVRAVEFRDVPLLLATSLICASAYIALVLTADLLSYWANPRLRQPLPGV
ncbi:MAG: ABC transporter permease [Pseudomonadota bacterium]